SSATGTGQFIDSTWRAFATANPQLFAGMTPDQVMAARNDPKLGQAAVTWLAQQNATEMKAQGVEPSGTSLRVAHWVGAGPAAKIMQAPDQTPVSSFLSPEAVAANPELATMTAGQMRQRFANVPNPSFLQPQQPGRVQVASADTGTRTDATTTPPAPGAQQPTQQPPQQQPQQQPQQPAQSGEPIPPPGQLTARQMAQYRALNPRTTDPKDSAAMLERFEQHNEQRRQHAAAATRQAQADTRLAQQDAAAAEQTNYNRAQDAKKEILAAEDRRIKEEDRQIKLKADQEAALRAGREDEAKALAAKALESKTRFDQSNTLRDEATKITETFRPVQESYERIGAAAAAGNSLGDLALIYTYTRLLDPATVHEEEVKRGMKAGGLAEYVSGWLARVTKGESLTPAVRQQFAEMGRKFYDVRKKGYEKELGAYRQLAEKFGLDPDSVAVSLARDQGPPPGMTVVIP
ncbi:MAG TPA: hypothetical protein VJV39_09180, partial [Dongiaceae bacterium]|nr:hypothetical protein [Dongiaceae bacterium]